jgi:hypothetical protein
VVDTVTLRAAVSKGLPDLHTGEGVLDASANFAVGGVVFLFPGGEFALAFLPAMWDDQAGALVVARP